MNPQTKPSQDSLLSQTPHIHTKKQGPEGVYTYTTAHLRKEDCLVCGSTEVAITCPRTQTLAELIDALKADPQVCHMM